MPGLYVHMDIARKSLSNLAGNAGAAALFGAPGPTAAKLEQIAKDHPAYTALGSIGPDMFFLLPDFKPPVGTGLWGAANMVKDLYEWWDENFLEPWDATLGPVAANTADELGALTGGLITQLGDIASQALDFLVAYVEVLITRQYDVFGLLGSGVPEGVDEQTFFWSDMFHYRKTFEFARHLFTKAQAEGNESHLAFALGWMSHLATDVTGHAFTNEKCGGPYRLHWQRHHLVENHMDGKVCDSQHGADPIYNMLSNTAQHLWVAFNPDGTSRHDFFANQPGPTYATGDTTPDILDRKSKWDVDSDLPPDLAQFIAEAASEFYTDAQTDVAGPTGMHASHPTIIEDYVPGSNGYADPDALTTMYWWVYKYLKWTTTDYYKMRRPDAPDVVIVPPFPSPPGSGSASPGPGGDDNAWASALEILLAIFAWLLYLVQALSWGITTLISIISSLSTYPIRVLVYEFIEVPLYNAWLALHWYLAHTGFVQPMRSELNPGLMTLGMAPVDAWDTLQSALDDLSGGIITPAPTATEPSGANRSRRLPKEAVVDDPSLVSVLSALPIGGSCTGSRTPSAFLRPWAYPQRNLDGTPVRTEPGTVPRLSPYPAPLDATVLTAPQAGSATAREAFEKAQSEQDTLAAQTSHLPQGRNLGGPIDFTGYVVAKLTRDEPGEIANFNLDADRGYGYLCWDWVRLKDSSAAPAAYRDAGNPANSGHQYRPPAAAGYGWCADEMISGATPPMHDPTAPAAVDIRYIDREGKF